jgi:predicted nucleic acid-binding protein
MSGTLTERLSGFSRLYLDANVLISFVQDDPRHGIALAPLFERIAEGDAVGMTSTLTITEVLVRPYQQKRLDLVERYRATFFHVRGFEVLPVDQEIAETGARLRAEFRFRTPDAIQLATAIAHGADVFLTDDAELARYDGMPVMSLDQPDA